MAQIIPDPLDLFVIIILIADNKSPDLMFIQRQVGKQQVDILSLVYIDSPEEYCCPRVV